MRCVPFYYIPRALCGKQKQLDEDEKHDEIIISGI